MIDFGKSLRAVQEIQGVRSVELASRFGVHAQQIHRWRYQKTGSLALIHKICKELNYDELEFIALGTNGS